MSVQKVNVLVPPLRSVPRIAAWLGESALWLLGGQGHAAAGLGAWVNEIREKVAREHGQRRDARARGDLMAMARRYESSQPEFAKDLFAAAANDRRD